MKTPIKITLYCLSAIVLFVAGAITGGCIVANDIYGADDDVYEDEYEDFTN